jgi:excisionase family DNA binding protein
MQDQTSRQLSGERWLSVEEITVHLGVARDTVYRWIDAKGLPAHRLGKLWKFKVSEVDSWVRSGGANEASRGHKQASASRRRKR